MGLEHFVTWLSQTPWSIALHEFLYNLFDVNPPYIMYPLLELIHVISITLFVGTISMVDLRLLGLAFKEVPVSQINARILPWTLTGFVIMVISGLLLFYAIPIRTYHSLWFRIKVILLIAAAINVWFFHRRVERDRARWDTAPKPPASARISAGISLALWFSVIVMGRMIAYNWFDCDKPLSHFVLWFTQCHAMIGMGG